MTDKLFRSIFAGMAIALGGWAYLSAPNPIIGAVIFACGLLTVRLYKLHLFTGKVQYIITDNEPWYYYPLILLGNFIGVAFIACISYSTVNNAAANIALAKASQPMLTAFVKGIGCGMLMSLATYEKTPLWITVLAVATFILAGFNHCIADFYYMLSGINISFNLVLTILGNIIGGIIFSAQRLSNI
jgi:formate/nitrite transporter FocA (FNT family)